MEPPSSLLSILRAHQVLALTVASVSLPMLTCGKFAARILASYFAYETDSDSVFDASLQCLRGQGAKHERLVDPTILAVCRGRITRYPACPSAVVIFSSPPYQSLSIFSSFISPQQFRRERRCCGHGNRIRRLSYGGSEYGS